MAMSRAEKGELIGVGIGLVLSLILGVLSLTQAHDANTAAALANQRADAANAIASQALDLQKSDFLANAASDAGKVKVTFQIRDFTYGLNNTYTPGKILEIVIENRSPRDMNSAILRIAPCKQDQNQNTACSSADPAWKTDIGRVAGCTRDTFDVHGSQVSGFPPNNLGAALDWVDAAGSTWELVPSATAASGNPRPVRSARFTDLPLRSQNEVLSDTTHSGTIGIYLAGTVAISGEC